ncbi:MAG: hypothetical protein ABW061_24225 [Polyangiaceae bacterium]
MEAATDPCSVMCDHSRALHCNDVARCAENCAELVKQPLCKSELERALHCIVAEPRQHWECSEDGLAAIKVGFCDPEQAAYAACMERSAPAPGRN